MTDILTDEEIELHRKVLATKGAGGGGAEHGEILQNGLTRVFATLTQRTKERDKALESLAATGDVLQERGKENEELKTKVGELESYQRVARTLEEEKQKLREENAKCKAVIFKLWTCLDDISTCGDRYKPKVDGYFGAVNKKAEEGLKVCVSDGYKVFYNGEDLS